MPQSVNLQQYIGTHKLASAAAPQYHSGVQTEEARLLKASQTSLCLNQQNSQNPLMVLQNIQLRI